MSTRFVHLHLHTEYSMLDGLCRLHEVVEEAEKLGLEALAITDHHSVGGAVQLYQLARERGIKPIIGVELNVGSIVREDSCEMYHIVLLAKDNQGYANILALISQSNLTNDGLVTRSMLEQHKQGLLVLSGCEASETNTWLLEDREKAREAALLYRNLFGQKNYYLEVARAGLPGEEERLKELVSLARELNIPLVATNNVHYIKREDASIHQALKAIQRLSFEEVYPQKKREEYYLKTAEEMAALFLDLLEALENSVHIAERCNVFLDFEQRNFPRIALPEGWTAETCLRKLCTDGLERLGHSSGHVVENMLEYELAAINRLGATGYFLIVADLLHYARQEGIQTFTRGSANGSLVAYLLGITAINPLAYRLYPEMFLGAHNGRVPEIELALDGAGQKKLYHYLVQKYGEDRVAHIATPVLLDTATVVRDMARAENWPREKLARLLRLLALKDNRRYYLSREIRGSSGGDTDEALEKVALTLQKLQGLPRHLGVHPTGVVISEAPLYSYTALQYAGDGEVITQLDAESIENLGLMQLKLAGLRHLSINRLALQMLTDKSEQNLTLETVPLNDPKTFRLLQRGDTVGCFELDSDACRRMLQEIRPVSLNELVLALAFFPREDKEITQSFLMRLHGAEEVTYPHPLLTDILQETYGLIIFTEQVREVARYLAGFTEEEAAGFARDLQEKNRLSLAALKSKFVKGTSSRLTALEANYLFDELYRQRDSFLSKSNLVAIAKLGYFTAYLKTHHAPEYLAALLNVNRDLHPRFRKYVNRDQYFSLPILPVDINASQALSVAVEGKIRLGLLQVKGVGQRAIKEIITAREKGEFISLTDFCQRMDLRVVHRSVIENLLKARAFDSFGARQDLIWELKQIFAIDD